MTQRSGDSSSWLLEAAPDAIVAVRADGRIALVNGATERLFGYRREDLVGQPVEILGPEAVRGLHPGHRHDYVADPRPRPMAAGMELAARRRDGIEFPAEISLSAIETDEGLLVTAAIRDVTDRKKAEAKFRGLLEAAPDAIVGVDPAGRITLVNAATERLFGYRREELIGQPVEILVPDAVRADHPGHRGRYLADPQPRPMGAGMALAARRRDGTEFPAEISLSALETEDGLLVSAAVRDVTERQKAAEAQSRLASIVQSSHDAIIGKNIHGVIQSWNPGATRIYGYTEEEMRGRNAEILFLPQRQEEEAQLLTRIVAGERVEQHQTERIHKNGTVVAVALTLSPILDAAGRIVGVASISRDVGELLRAEARFRGLLEAARTRSSAWTGTAGSRWSTPRPNGFSATGGRTWSAGRWRSSSRTPSNRLTLATGIGTCPIPDRGRWAPGCNWPAAGGTAPSSRPRSPCPLWTPHRASWCPPRSGT